MKTNRRDFLKSIAATAITAATGFAMSAVRVEEVELTEAERRYGEILAGGENYPSSVQAGIDAMESYVAGFDLSMFDKLPPLRPFWPMLSREQGGLFVGADGVLRSNVVSIDDQAERWEVPVKVIDPPGVYADPTREDWIWGRGENGTLILSTDGGENYEEYQPSGCILRDNPPCPPNPETDPCQVDFYVQHGRCDDKLIGTVESVNDDGSVNVELCNYREGDPLGWVIDRPTYEATEFTVKLDIDG